MSSRIWIVLWIAGILFPMEFLARVWPAFGRIFNPIFSPDWIHIIMHTLLYTMLAFLLAQAISPISPRAILVLVGLGLLVGCLQESLQLFSARLWPGWPPEILDLSVDLGGTIIGIILSRFTMYKKEPPTIEKRRPWVDG
jgi:VanZ family protein